MRIETRSRRTLTVAAWLLSATAAVAQFAPTGQFAPYAPFGYPYDRVQGEWINLETELIKPILFIPGSGPVQDLVAVANPADDRVVFLDRDLNYVGETVVGQGPAALAKDPNSSELWVSVRDQSSVVVIDLATRNVTHVLRPPINPGDVGAGHASTPGGIAFANGRAYVAATFSDELLVYLTASKTFLHPIPLQAQHNGLPGTLNDPFGVTSFNGRIFVTSHLSGNNTTARLVNGANFDGPAFSLGSLGPDKVAITKLSAIPGLSLPDFDVAIIDPSNDSVQAMVKGVGTVNFVAAGDTGSGRVLVTNLEARNADFIGEGSFPQGKVAFNRFTWIDPATATVIGTPVVTEALGAGNANVVMPTDVAILSGGTVCIAGYCSSNIGVWNAAGAFVGTIPTPAGPRGLSYARTLGRLYCLSRGEQKVTVFDVSVPSAPPQSPLKTFDLADPTFDGVKAGRIEFLKPNSGAGTTNCATCHIDGRADGIAWNLSKTLSENPIGATPDFRDRKGVMVTQNLEGTLDDAPYHWRGEQFDIENFNGAFKGLLKGQELAPHPLANLKEYILSLTLPPNPFQPMDRLFSNGATGIFEFAGGGNSGANCTFCHAVPLGSNSDTPCPIFGDQALVGAMKVPPLRGMWTKLSPLADVDSSNATEMIPATGYGLLHEGVFDDVAQVMSKVFSGVVPPFSDHFMNVIRELDSGLAAATLFSEMLDVTTANTPRADSIELYMLQQADSANCDVAARGQLDFGSGFVNVGLVYRPVGAPANGGLFERDDVGATQFTFSFQTLESMAAAGTARLLFLGVPVGSGERVGIDRDRDGVRDTDELQAGLDVDDPDTDGDGLWDGYDTAPLNANAGAPTGAPQVVGTYKVVLRTTDTIKITYDTDTFSPTIVHFGTSAGALANSTGDGLQTVGPTTGNYWKKHHTALLRPQPTQTPPLMLLDPATNYFFDIQTQGQNGAVATSAVNGPEPSSTNTSNPNTFRASKVDYRQRINNGNGTFTYTVTATFTVTQGTATLAGMPVPGRFTIYDTAGNYVFTNLSSTTTTNGSGITTAVFSLTTLPGQQVSGNRVTFDLPMWAAVPAGSVNIVGFPSVFTTGLVVVAAGIWSDSVTFAETTAP